MMKLSQLQNLMNRDPESFREEFLLQKRCLENEIDILKLGTKNTERFTELLSFMSHVSFHFTQESKEIPSKLIELLETQANILTSDVRVKLFKAIILFRKKTNLDPVAIIKLCFNLYATVSDETLRTTIGDYIFKDIKNMNSSKRNEAMNRKIQALLFGIMKDNSVIAARKAVELLSELYRRRIWTDSRTVNVLAEACTNQSIRVVVSSIKFFLNIEAKMFDDE